MGIQLTRDDEGQLVPGEPMYVWQGEDIPESLLARFGEPTFYPSKTAAEHREIWERESIQAHAAEHGFTTAEP
jgi:hypothetical protein